MPRPRPGHAVWRFSAGGIRRALDAGRMCDDITADLAAIAAGPLPQPLTYLITDTARGHGRVRVSSAACVIHGDEPALLAELAAQRRLTTLGLRQLAPTVLISRSPLDTTLATLRAEGYAPAADNDVDCAKDSDPSGCRYMDMTELIVHGKPHQG